MCRISRLYFGSINHAYSLFDKVYSIITMMLAVINVVVYYVDGNEQIGFMGLAALMLFFNSMGRVIVQERYIKKLENKVGDK